VYSQKCLSLDPLYPNALTNLGLAYESVGNLLEAEKAYKRSMKVTPRDEETLELLARCHLARGKHRDAVTAFTKLRDLLPEDLEVRTRFGSPPRLLIYLLSS
jgi:tetratricopeptide (TPR) repeat protein